MTHDTVNPPRPPRPPINPFGPPADYPYGPDGLKLAIITPVYGPEEELHRKPRPDSDQS
jgi:hypothetical protein